MIKVNDIKARVAQDFSNMQQFLAEFVALPSVSSTADWQTMEQSAKQVGSWFEQLGLEVSIKTAFTPDGKEGKPAVVAKRIVDPEKPTVLLYAHHDVQPEGPVERWQSDPFKAEVRDGRMYGRGASDDGAGIMVHLGALRALGDECPVNVVCYIEGEEEIGSPSFRNFIETYQDELNADVVVICDSNNWRVGKPALTSSLRGITTVDVHLKVMEHALHSGAYGGPILDAVSLGAILISKLYREDGGVAVPGLGGSEEAQVDYPEDLFRSDASLVPGYKLAGAGDFASRLWYQPALAVIGWDQRDVATSANAIAPETKFRLSMRIAPGSNAKDCADKLCRFIEENVPFGAEVSTNIVEFGPSYQGQPTAAKADMEWALEQAWGVKSVDIGCGGAIPMTADFMEVMPEAQILITGVEDPATNAHSENESQDLGDLESAIVAEALLLAKTGGAVE